MKQIKSSYFRDTLGRFMRHKLAVVGLIVILAELLLLLLLPLVMDLQPTTITDVFYGDPSSEHILGTDRDGRDVFARLIYGGRTSLKFGFLAVLVQACIGVPLGIIAGYYRGPAEMIIMRLADMFQSIPSMCLNIVLVSVLSPSAGTLVLVIGVMGVIMLRYILPNAVSPALVAFTFGIPSAILSESALSFLGLGIQIPEASWGNLLNAAQSIAIVSMKPWLWIPPGLCIFITLISVNLFGDGLRDALDPKTKV